VRHPTPLFFPRRGRGGRESASPRAAALSHCLFGLSAQHLCPPVRSDGGGSARPASGSSRSAALSITGGRGSVSGSTPQIRHLPLSASLSQIAPNGLLSRRGPGPGEGGGALLAFPLPAVPPPDLSAPLPPSLEWSLSRPPFFEAEEVLPVAPSSPEAAGIYQGASGGDDP